MDNPSGPVVGISELALWVEDLDRSLAFYRDLLGFTVSEIDPGRNAFLRSGDLLLALFVTSDPGTPLASEYLARTGGPRGLVYHVGFRVPAESLDGFGRTLTARGVSVRGPVEFPNGRRSYFLEDPDEHYIELTDR